MRVLMVAIVMGATSIASLGVAQAAPLGTPTFAPPSLLQNVADQEMTVVGTAVNVRQHPTSNSKVLHAGESGYPGACGKLLALWPLHPGLRRGDEKT